MLQRVVGNHSKQQASRSTLQHAATGQSIRQTLSILHARLSYTVNISIQVGCCRLGICSSRKPGVVVKRVGMAGVQHEFSVQ